MYAHLHIDVTDLKVLDLHGTIRSQARIEMMTEQCLEEYREGFTLRLC
jgi:hypothetical protein